MTPWNQKKGLIYSGNVSLWWLFTTANADNKNKKLGELLNSHIEKTGMPIITPGLLLMAAYLQFVFPKESKIADFKKLSLNTEDFKVKKWIKDKKDRKLGDPMALFRRIRNSISHANLKVKEGNILAFKDIFKGSEVFEAEIGMVGFGNFLSVLVDKLLFNNSIQRTFIRRLSASGKSR